MDLSGKVVLITGASSGIGAACAERLAALGARLALSGRHAANLAATARRCEAASGAPPLELRGDVTRDEDAARLVADTVRRYGRLDVLVNGAGAAAAARLDAGVAPYDACMAVNVRAPYLLCALAAPHLAASGGCVVNVSSVLATKPAPAFLPYCVSKAALDMLTRCLALELGPRGVRVNGVSPGPVRTELFTRAGVPAEAAERMFAALERALPLRRVPGAADVAALVAFLASDAARCVTGAAYTVDCGLLLGDDPAM